MAVLRGIPYIFSTGKIKYYLMEVEFELTSVSRMHKNIEGTRIDKTLI